MTNPSWLPRAALRTAEYSWSLASVLSEYCRLEGRTLDDIAAMLRCGPDVLDWLSLCRRPAAERFSEDLQTIVARFAIDAVKLGEIVRRVGAVELLRKGQSSVADNGNSLLLAARDRDEDGETE